MKYRKKPIVVEAFQLGYDEFPEWAEDALMEGLLRIEDDHAVLFTIEGEMRADIGSYIIKGVDGELYPCWNDSFQKTYERVNE